jgi:prepilin-type N-terminal cleavage/methylation domain-containing protein
MSPSLGFTMVEMLIVVALIGIVASIALPSYRNAQLKAREAVLREDLWVLNDVVNQYYTDRGHSPESLDALTEAGYLMVIPVDPMTGSRDSWITETEPLGAEAPEEEEVDLGITRVRSGATGVALDGTEYSSW